MADREFMMPIPPEGAAMQFFIEALKANTEVLKGMQADLKEDRVLLRDVRERVIKIESNRVDRRVDGLETRVDALEKDRDTRDGALSAGTAIWKNLPSAAAVLLGIVVIAILFLKITGRI
jgi:hypothetical protein